MKSRIVFILTSVVNTNSIKRIDEFVSRGYDVRAFGFKRDVDVVNKSACIEISVIGSYKNDLPYIKRLSTIYKGIRNVLKEPIGKDNIYYLIGLDVAMIFRLQSNRPYIYEEADLVHTNIGIKVGRAFYEKIDKTIIKQSVFSVFRSEGFVTFHFGDNVPKNVCVIPNRLSNSILKCSVLPKHIFNEKHIVIGYVGFIRYYSIFNFARVFCDYYPNCEFHFYGTFTNEKTQRQFKKLEKYRNCIFHGPFKSPDDLNKIYSQFDLVLCTYDVSSENVRWAEPNKIYEAIYFETPIVVSSNTFLADKVKRLGIGYDIDAMDEKSIVTFVEKISSDGMRKKIMAIKKISKEAVINWNDVFFEKIKILLSKNRI